MAKSNLKLTDAEARKFLTFVEKQFGRKYAEVAERAATLTERELEVFCELGAGVKNEHIAAKLGISTKTLDIHRAVVSRKMGVRSLNGYGPPFWLFKFGRSLAPGGFDEARRKCAAERQG